MNSQETLQVLAIVKVAYPNSFNKFTKQDVEMLAKLWQIQFKDYDYKLVMGAVNTIIATDLNDFMPTIAKIKDTCLKLSSNDDLDETQAWQLVKKAMGNSIYHAKEEFNKLPEICKKMVGSSDQLRQWGTMNSDEVNTVIYSNFIKGFRSVKESQRKEELIPLSVKEELKQIEEKTNA